jgi:hypothetical protein
MKTVYLRAVNPNWAARSIAVIAINETKVQLNCGNIMAICGPDNHYQMGTGVSICGGYNRHIGFNPTHREFLV